MSTVSTKPKRRKHHPELLRFKRAARALQIDWADVTAERDRLRAFELEQREQADSLHKAATTFYGGPGSLPFWRGFFRRKFARLIASGGDYTSVPKFDVFVQQHFGAGRDESTNGDCVTNGWTCQDAWDLLTEERPPLRSIWEVYGIAVQNIILGRQGDSSSVPF